MATISFKNGDEYLMKISKLEAAMKDEVCGEAIYGAAGIVADEIRKQLEAVPTDERYGTSSDPTRGPKAVQKEALLDALGISSMQEHDGYLDVKIGFDGYNGVTTKRWPNGQPNQMVARSVDANDTIRLIHIVPFNDMWMYVAAIFLGVGMLIGVWIASGTVPILPARTSASAALIPL